MISVDSGRMCRSIVDTYEESLRWIYDRYAIDAVVGECVISQDSGRMCRSIVDTYEESLRWICRGTRSMRWWSTEQVTL